MMLEFLDLFVFMWCVVLTCLSLIVLCVFDFWIVLLDCWCLILLVWVGCFEFVFLLF